MSTHPSNCRQSNSKAQAVLGAKVPQHLKVLLATEQCLAGGMTSLRCGRQLAQCGTKLGVVQVYEHAIPATLAPASPVLPHTCSRLDHWPGPGRPRPHVFSRRDLQRPAPAQCMPSRLLFLHLPPMPPLRRVIEGIYSRRENRIELCDFFCQISAEFFSLGSIGLHDSKISNETNITPLRIKLGN